MNIGGMSFNSRTVREQLGDAVFLDGVSCTYKTTVMERLQKEGYPCIVGDFSEHVRKYPSLLKQMADRPMSLVYLALLFLEHRTQHIIDRCWFANVVYSIVNHYPLDKVTSVCEQLYAELPPPIIESLRDMKVLIILEKSPAANVQRMKKRASEIDSTLPIDYVLKQNRVFKYFADVFDWRIEYCNDFEPPTAIQDRIMTALKEMLVLEVTSSSETEAGEVDEISTRATVVLEDDSDQ